MALARRSGSNCLQDVEQAVRDPYGAVGGPVDDGVDGRCAGGRLAFGVGEGVGQLERTVPDPGESHFYGDLFGEVHRFSQVALCVDNRREAEAIVDNGTEAHCLLLQEGLVAVVGKDECACEEHDAGGVGVLHSYYGLVFEHISSCQNRAAAGAEYAL